MKKTFLINLICFLVVLCIFPLWADQKKPIKDTSFNDIKERKVLRIGIGDTFPPVSFRDSKTKDLRGLDIDIGRRLAAEFNVTAEFVSIAWEDKFVELNNGNIDCIMSGFSQVNERENQVIFSKPYLKNSQVIIVKKKSDISGKTDLQDKKLGFMSGSSSEKWIDVNPFTANNVKKIPYKNNQLAVEALRSGKIDAMVVDEVMARSLDTRLFKTINPDFGEEAYVIGFGKNAVTLRNEVNKFLEKNIETVNSYIIKWLGPDFKGLILSAASDEDHSFEIIKTRGILRIGIDDTFKPMTFRDKGTNELTGLDIDIGETMCKKLGIKAEFVVMPWNEKDIMLNSNKIDCVMSGMSDIPERRNRMIVSRSYFPNYHAILVKEGCDITGVNDLREKKIGFKDGSSSERWIRLDPVLRSTVKMGYQTTQLLFQALESGAINAAILDMSVALDTMLASPGLFTIIGNLGEEEYVIGFRTKDLALRNEIDKVIDTMRVEGTLNKAINRWFGGVRQRSYDLPL